MSRPASRATKLFLASLLAGGLSLAAASAHDAPTSFIDLRVTPEGLDANLTASNTDLAHGLAQVEPAMLLQPAVIAAQRDALAAMLQSRLHITVAGHSLGGELRTIAPVLENRDLRFAFYYPWSTPPPAFSVQCRLFPYDQRHRTFLNIYQSGRLEQQNIFEGDAPPVAYRTGSHQGVLEVVRQFVFEGIHHIFIGPDHILFATGLLLLGGSITKLLKIVTAFTVAHSITLGLAVFGIVRPPASIVEPLIALSVVFVGASALLGKGERDPRLLLAFGFGLVHGFGFASALQEMMLPREALGWSLFAFNTGVEIGQACIVVTVATLLAQARKLSLAFEQRVVTIGALCVTSAGAFWFFQRVLA